MVVKKILKQIIDNTILFIRKNNLHWIYNNLTGKDFICNIPNKCNGSVSDFIPWRCDDQWDTKYNIMNLSSFVLPDKNISEDVALFIFDNNGDLLKKVEYNLEPFETIDIIFSEVLTEYRNGFGTFCIFHKSSSNLAEYKSFIFDRQYVSHKRRNDDLWSYVHGNLVSTFKSYDDDNIKSLVPTFKDSYEYCPQIIFTDCNKTELFYTNQTDKDLDIKFILYKNDGKIKIINSIIPARNIFMLPIENDVLHVKNISNVKLLRPVIFKFYNNHYDVLHG